MFIFDFFATIAAVFGRYVFPFVRETLSVFFRDLPRFFVRMLPASRLKNYLLQCQLWEKIQARAFSIVPKRYKEWRFVASHVNDNKKGVFLAFIPCYKSALITGPMKVFILNNTSHAINYSLKFKGQEIKNEQIEACDFYKLDYISRNDLDYWINGIYHIDISANDCTLLQGYNYPDLWKGRFLNKDCYTQTRYKEHREKAITLCLGKPVNSDDFYGNSCKPIVTKTSNKKRRKIYVDLCSNAILPQIALYKESLPTDEKNSEKLYQIVWKNVVKDNIEYAKKMWKLKTVYLICGTQNEKSGLNVTMTNVKDYLQNDLKIQEKCINEYLNCLEVDFFEFEGKPKWYHFKECKKWRKSHCFLSEKS